MAATKKSTQIFSDEERAAMKEAAAEQRRDAKRGASAAAGEADLLAKIAEMDDSDRVIAERIHAIVAEVAPQLESKTWYGQPAYTKDGKVVCFFQAASKFKTRYATLGFQETAALDDGSMWPTSWAITSLTKADEQVIGDLIRRAAG